MNKDNGRYPTRAELFKKCYSKADGTSEAIQQAITQMEELAAQNSENSNSNNGIHDPNDDFAKVMGKDKDGQLRLYGMGVKAGDVYGAKPSRDALFRQSMKYKEKYFQEVEKFEALNAKVEELTSNVNANGMELERDFCEIVIQFQVKRDARLLFPHSHFQTIGDALGVPIVWPLSMVELDEDEN